MIYYVLKKRDNNKYHKNMYTSYNEPKSDYDEFSKSCLFNILDLEPIFLEDTKAKNLENFINFNITRDIDDSISKPSNQEISSETKLGMENLKDIHNLFLFKECNRHYFEVFRQNKPRGRKTIRERNNKRTHDRYAKDNLLRKIRVQSINFLIDLLNFVLTILGIDKKFRDISKKFKIQVKQKEIVSLKNMKIKEIICQELSTKYKIDKINDNTIILESIKDAPILKNLLFTNYLEVFKKLYYNNKEKEINLKDYGADKEQIYKIPKKIKIFEDLLIKYKNNLSYKKKLIEYVENYILNE